MIWACTGTEQIHTRSHRDWLKCMCIGNRHGGWTTSSFTDFFFFSFSFFWLLLILFFFALLLLCWLIWCHFLLVLYIIFFFVPFTDCGGVSFVLFSSSHRWFAFCAKTFFSCAHTQYNWSHEWYLRWIWRSLKMTHILYSLFHVLSFTG